MTEKVTAEGILESLKGRFKDERWVYLEEYSPWAGYGGGKDRRVDLFGINIFHSKRFYRVGYEIKVSVSDFNRQLREPVKDALIRRYVNQYYYVTPPGIIKVERLPVGVGLIEVSNNGGMPKVIVESEWNEHNPDWGFVGQLLQRLKKLTPEDL